MNWQDELRELANAEKWSEVCLYAIKAVEETPANSAVSVEALFLTLNKLLYQEFESQGQFDETLKALDKLFSVSYSSFKNNGEYLFFVGYFMALGDWAFGQDDLSLSHDMLRRAAQLDPGNRLFEWGYRFSTSDPRARSLTEDLYFDDSIMRRLISMGEAGKFMAEAIETAYERYKKGQIPPT
jgi:hypothetical protein